MASKAEIPDDRELTNEEASLVHWLLNYGYPCALDFLSQFRKARVASRCSCGCASINLAIDGVLPENGTPITVLSDYEWTDADGRLFGAFVFARCGLLAGLEIWSQDGLTTASILPEINQLRPIGTGSLGEQSHPPEPATGPVLKSTSSPPTR